MKANFGDIICSHNTEFLGGFQCCKVRCAGGAFDCGGQGGGKSAPDSLVRHVFHL